MHFAYYQVLIESHMLFYKCKSARAVCARAGVPPAAAPPVDDTSAVLPDYLCPKKHPLLKDVLHIYYVKAKIRYCLKSFPKAC